MGEGSDGRGRERERVGGGKKARTKRALSAVKRGERGRSGSRGTRWIQIIKFDWADLGRGIPPAVRVCVYVCIRYIDSLAVFSAYFPLEQKEGEREIRRFIHPSFFLFHPQDKRGRGAAKLPSSRRRVVSHPTSRASFELHENRACFSRERERESSRSIATAQIRGKIIAPRPQELLLLERLRGSNESREGKGEREERPITRS